MGHFAWCNSLVSLVNANFTEDSKPQNKVRMHKSRCHVCGSSHTIKYGIRNGIQTYKCVDCGYRFRNSKLPSDLELWRLYQENKQTIAELATSLKT